MGGAESVVRNVDKRTARREHRSNFEGAVTRFRESPFAAPRQVNACVANNLSVYIRKRPFFPHEHKQGEFDVISCLPSRVVVHDARMQPDMRNMFMNHHDFTFDDVFDDNETNEEVFARSARSTVRSVAAGGHGTVMMYGQTGSGKTFTMSSFYKQAADEIFSTGSTSQLVSVSFIELLGDKCFDMLNGGAPCRLVGAQDGSVHPHPCAEVNVKDANELLALIRMAGKLRATAATGVHDQSSRSHALCRIFVNSESCDEEGSLTLLDLAGTEHRIDNAEHNAERQKEGAKINASLAALKDCIRATAAGAKFVAFRQNRLTQLLRGCFMGTRPHPTMVIATVSPSSKDTEHSLNTLRHACIMDGQGEGTAKQSAHVTGGVVTREALGEIDVTGIARAKAAARRSGKSPRPPEKPSLSHQSKQSNTVRRAGLDRRCIEALHPDLAERLLASRAGAGTERQRFRIQGPNATTEEASREEHEDLLIEDSGAKATSEAQLLHDLKPAWEEQFDGFHALDKAFDNLKIVVHEHESRTSPGTNISELSQDFSTSGAEMDDFEGEADILCPPKGKELPRSPTSKGSSPLPTSGCWSADSDIPPLRSSSSSSNVDLDITLKRPSKEFSSAVALDSVGVDIADFEWPGRGDEIARSPVGENSIDIDANTRAGTFPEIARTSVSAGAENIDIADFDTWPVRQSAIARSPVDCSVAEDHPSEHSWKKDQEKAEELFRVFCHRGREAVAWRKNDLRLINSHILPNMFGPTTQIDWNHPDVALDQLERLVCGPVVSEPEAAQGQERPRRLHGRQPKQEQTRSTNQPSRSTASTTPMASAKMASRSPGMGHLRQSSGGTNVRRETAGMRRSSPVAQRSQISKGESVYSPSDVSPSQKSLGDLTPLRSVSGKSQGDVRLKSSPSGKLPGDYATPPRDLFETPSPEHSPLRPNKSQDGLVSPLRSWASRPQTAPRMSQTKSQGSFTPQRQFSRNSLADQESTVNPGGKGIANLEAQVASASASVKNWLEELREQIRRDETTC